MRSEPGVGSQLARTDLELQFDHRAIATASRAALTHIGHTFGEGSDEGEDSGSRRPHDTGRAPPFEIDDVRPFSARFSELCTGCSRCVNQCPVRIDIPWLNANLRERINERDAASSNIFQRALASQSKAKASPQKIFFGRGLDEYRLEAVAAGALDL